MITGVPKVFMSLKKLFIFVINTFKKTQTDMMIYEQEIVRELYERSLEKMNREQAIKNCKQTFPDLDIKELLKR